MRNLPQCLVYVHSFLNLVPACNLQTRRKRHGVFKCLCCAIARGRQETVSAVSDLDDSGTRRCPLKLGISPPQLEVDDGLGWSALHQALEHGRPFGDAFRSVVHSFQHLIGFNGVIPRFCFRASDLWKSQFRSGHQWSCRYLHRG